jgi:hypothetical protein
MSTKRDAPSAKPTTGKRSVGSRARLEAEEERQLRMRYGLMVSDDHPLEQKGEGNAAVMAKLREIEQRAFEKSGRLAKMRAEAGVDEPAVIGSSTTKQKIVDKLKTKAGAAKKAVKVAKAEVKATAKAVKSAPKKKR